MMQGPLLRQESITSTIIRYSWNGYKRISVDSNLKLIQPQLLGC
jgi:hypothetical protein